jgi:transcriptional regulator with XRE-family HTH domain
MPRRVYRMSPEQAEVLNERLRLAITRPPTRTWTQVASEIGISQELLHNILSDKMIPTIHVLLMLCEHAGVTPNWMLGIEEREA